jgi:rod shape-determining protein MreC
VKILKGSSLKQIMIAFLLSATLLFFVMHYFFIKSPGAVEQAVSYVLYPVLMVQKKIETPFKNYKKRKKDHKELFQKLEKVQEENKSLHARITELEASKDFLHKTKNLVDFQKKYDSDVAHLAQIIFKRISNHEQIIMVSKGSSHGIVKDMVAVYKNNLLGKVVDVYPYYSTVMLVTDKRCNVSVYCSWIKTKGILQGANTIDYTLLTHVDRLKKLRKKELIISSGEGTVFPKGFRLGTVESFEPDGVHYKVIVSPSVDFYDLEYCYLLRKGAEVTL